MSAILLPTRLNKQPTDPLDIDRGNPLTRGIIFVSHGGVSGYDPITKTFPTTTGSGLSFGGVGPSGKAEVFGGGGYREYSHADSIPLANGYSVLSVARTTSLSSQSGLVAKWDTPSGINVPMTFFVRSSGELALWRNVGGTSNGTYGTTTTDGGTTGTSVISTNQDFVASVDTGSNVHDTANLYVNGAKRFSGWTFGPSGSNVALSEPTGSKFAVGTSNGGLSMWVGNIYLTICWNRRLSTQEHALLHANPWQIFQPIPRRIFIKPSAGGAYTVTAEAGAFSLGGQDATILKTRIVTADAGAFTLSGQDATISYLSGYILTAEAGAFTLGGQDATILKTRIVTGDAGAFTLSGQDASIVYVPAGSYVLSAEAGAFTLSGQSATIYKTKRITADAGAFTLSGQSASFIYSGAPVVTEEVPRQEGIDWATIVYKTLGKDYDKPEYVYEFSNGRRFVDKKNPYA